MNYSNANTDRIHQRENNTIVSRYNPNIPHMQEPQGEQLMIQTWYKHMTWTRSHRRTIDDTSTMNRHDL